MTTTRRILWAGAAAVSLLWPLLAAAGIARANGIGDLYIGAGSNVVEAHLAGKAIVNAVKLPEHATSLAFSNDGKTLFITTGSAEVQVIDIETISLATPITAAGPAVTVAHPSGARVAVAIPDLARVALLNPEDGTSNDVAVSGPVDLLAADRRESVFLAAATTGGWVAVIDAALGTSHTVAVDGRVTGLAIDRDTGGAYVATKNPDTVLRLELGTAKISWSAKVDESPTAIAATTDQAVVATGSRLLGVTSKGAKTFATLPSDVTALAGTDDGKVLIAATKTMVQGFGAAGGEALSEVDLPEDGEAVAIAPVPKPIVLEGSGTPAPKTPTPRPVKTAAASAGAGATSGSQHNSGTKRPAATHAPATSTDPLGARPEVAPPLLGAAIVGGVILAAWWGISLAAERRQRALARAVRAAGPKRRRRRRRPPPGT